MNFYIRKYLHLVSRFPNVYYLINSIDFWQQKNRSRNIKIILYIRDLRRKGVMSLFFYRYDNLPLDDL